MTIAYGKAAAAAVMLCITGLAGSCAGTTRGASFLESATPGVSRNDPRGYLATGDGLAAYLEWTRTGSDVNGNLALTEAREDAAPETKRAAFSGKTDGHALTLRFSDWTGLGSWTGTLDARQITFHVVGSQGVIRDLVFRPATPNDYNLAREMVSPWPADQTAQSNLRNAFTAEKTFYTDAGAYSEQPSDLIAIEPSLSFSTGSRPTTPGEVVVEIVDSILYLSTRSASGRCFYLSDDSTTTRYGTATSCANAINVSYSYAPW